MSPRKPRCIWLLTTCPLDEVWLTPWSWSPGNNRCPGLSVIPGGPWRLPAEAAKIPCWVLGAVDSPTLRFRKRKSRVELKAPPPYEPTCPPWECPRAAAYPLACGVKADVWLEAISWATGLILKAAEWEESLKGFSPRLGSLFPISWCRGVPKPPTPNDANCGPLSRSIVMSLKQTQELGRKKLKIKLKSSLAERASCTLRRDVPRCAEKSKNNKNKPSQNGEKSYAKSWEKKLPLTAIREKEDQTSPPYQADDVLGLIKSITHSQNINELGRQCYDGQSAFCYPCNTWLRRRVVIGLISGDWHSLVLKMAVRLNCFHLIGCCRHYFAGITERSSADPACVMWSACQMQPYTSCTPDETPKQF